MSVKYFYNKILAGDLYKLLILGVVFFVLSCGKQKNNEVLQVKPKPKVESDAIIKPVTDISALSLPLGKKPKDFKDVKTYDQYIGNDLLSSKLPVKKLPGIISTSYMVADNNNGLGLCYEKPVTIKLMHYKYRLPDYKGFQIYYMCGDEKRAGELKTEFGVDCLSSYGNLIVYNPKTKYATVLTVYYSFYIDAQQQRCFYIDKDYTIYLADVSYSEGEDGADFTPGAIYKAIITNNGSFKILKVYEHR